MNLKRKLEQRIANEFIKNKNVIPPSKNYKLKEHGDAPDFIIKDDIGNEIGLEITSAYYDQGLAKGYFELLRSAKGGIDYSQNVILLNPDIMLISFVKKILNKKCLKNYGEQPILIIYVDAPVWNNRKLNRIRGITSDLKRNPFSEIYVCVEVPHSTEFSPNAGKLTFYRIYPYTDKFHNLDYETYNNRKKGFEKQAKKLKKMAVEKMEEEFKDMRF
jgi:hypothetical protein